MLNLEELRGPMSGPGAASWQLILSLPLLHPSVLPLPIFLSLGCSSHSHPFLASFAGPFLSPFSCESLLLPSFFQFPILFYAILSPLTLL